jgi:hypothetical protein
METTEVTVTLHNPETVHGDNTCVKICSFAQVIFMVNVQ